MCWQEGTRWYHKDTMLEKGGEVERNTNLTLPSYVCMAGGKQLANWPRCRRERRSPPLSDSSGCLTPPLKGKAPALVGCA